MHWKLCFHFKSEKNYSNPSQNYTLPVKKKWYTLYFAMLKYDSYLVKFPKDI